MKQNLNTDTFKIIQSMKAFTFILGCVVFGGCIALIIVEEMCSPSLAMLCTRVWAWCGVLWSASVLFLTAKTFRNA